MAASVSRYEGGIGAALLCAAVLLNIVGALSLQAALSSVDLRRQERIVPRAQRDAVPVRLKIPALNVDAPILQVGLRPDGFMDIPPTAADIGWFSPGFIPGERGNAVMAGHLDTQSGKPAVFWALRRLKKGDTVEVIRRDGSSVIFIVTGKAAYAEADAPLERLFGSSTGSHLNLVTCHGKWQEGKLRFQFMEERMPMRVEEWLHSKA